MDYRGRIYANKSSSDSEILEGLDYPAKKQNLIEHAKKQYVSNEVLQDLDKIPDKEYTSITDIDRELEGI